MLSDVTVQPTTNTVMFENTLYRVTHVFTRTMKSFVTSNADLTSSNLEGNY